MRTLRRPLLVTGLLSICRVMELSGQVITGTIRDAETGAALAGATVSIVTPRDSVRAVSLTAGDGVYRLASRAGDTVRVRAERLGYGAMESQLLVMAEASQLTLDVELRAEPIALEPVSVIARRWTRNREGFERRRRSEIWGRFADEEQLTAMRSARPVDKLRPFIPGMVAWGDGTIAVPKRGADLTGVPTCQPRFVIDGIRYPGDLSLDVLVTGRSIRALEYYREPQWAPAEFAMGHDVMVRHGMTPQGEPVSDVGLAKPCAIIVIWTDRAFGPPEG